MVVVIYQEVVAFVYISILHQVYTHLGLLRKILKILFTRVGEWELEITITLIIIVIMVFRKVQIAKIFIKL
jgi:hypothetical protein